VRFPRTVVKTITGTGKLQIIDEALEGLIQFFFDVRLLNACKRPVDSRRLAVDRSFVALVHAWRDVIQLGLPCCYISYTALGFKTKVQIFAVTYWFRPGNRKEQRRVGATHSLASRRILPTAPRTDKVVAGGQPV
jgi:hypothetical protein